MKKYSFVLFFLLFPSLVSAGPSTIIFSKDLGSGITMEQTDTQTFIKLKGKVLKSFSNESKKAPFIEADGCKVFAEKMLNSGFPAQQTIWNNLGKEGQKDCMREAYQKNIQVLKVNSSKRFVLLQTAWYEGASSILVDLKLGGIQDGVGNIKKIILGKSGTYMQVNFSEGRGDCHGDIYLLNTTGKFILQFSMCKISKDTSTASLDTFELLANMQLQVRYTINGKITTKIYPIQTK